MRFMNLLEVDRSTEAGVLSDETLLTGRGKHNELVRATRTVVAGPFTEPKNRTSSFWLGDALLQSPGR